MSIIEEKLWTDLIREPEAHDALAARQPPAARRRSRRAPLAAGALALLGATLALALTLTASTSTTPAYAVTVNPDGSVSLTLDEVVGVRGANETLAKLGVRAQVAQIEARCSQTGEHAPSPEHREQIVEPQKVAGQEPSIEGQLQRRGAFAGVDLVIHPRAIPQADTALIAIQRDSTVTYHGKAISSLSWKVGLYRGTAPTCQPPAGE
jgi:hypothetical protein